MKKNVKSVIVNVMKYVSVLLVEGSGCVLGALLWFTMAVPDWMSVTLTLASLAAFMATIVVICDAVDREKKRKKRMAKRCAMREKKPLKTYKYL